VSVDRGVRLLTVKTGVDLTAAMERFSRERVSALAREDLSGYVPKKDSPSCGLERVKIYDRDGPPARNGRGLFAATLVEMFPHLPVEEEGRLANPRLRDNFVERVFAYWRLRGLFGRRWAMGDLVRFHTAHKLLLLAHAPEAYRQLGRLVAGGSGLARADVERRYVDGFMRALEQVATCGVTPTCCSTWPGTSGTGWMPRQSASWRRRSTSTGADSCRSSCRSHSSVTTYARST